MTTLMGLRHRITGVQRRALLTAVGASVAGLAGCGSSGDGASTPTSGATETATVSATSTERATATPTATPTQTRTPPDQRYRPQLLDANLVRMWSEPGDIEENAVESVRRGQPAVFAYRYRMRIPEGTINLKEGVDVSRGDDLVVRRFRDVDRRVDTAGLHTWEDAMTFETDDWPTGELTATVSVGELQLHRTADPIPVTFDVTE